MLEEKKLRDFFNRNSELMAEFSIKTRDDLINALGDRYKENSRLTLMDRMTVTDLRFLREFYLRNCKAGIDRSPACIKVTIDWAPGIAWTSNDEDCIVSLKIKLDRLKLQAQYDYKTKGGSKGRISCPISEEFESSFFAMAETTWFTEKSAFLPSLDADILVMNCIFGTDDVRGFDSRVNNVTEPFNTYVMLYQQSLVMFDLLRKH